MKIAILNGSPRNQNTATMVEAFCKGAEEAGHETQVLQVGKMKIGGCMGCEYCHTKGEGKCIQKDDMEKVMPAYLEADMIVYASPVYYFDMTAQLSAAMQEKISFYSCTVPVFTQHLLAELIRSGDFERHINRVRRRRRQGVEPVGK